MTAPLRHVLLWQSTQTQPGSGRCHLEAARIGEGTRDQGQRVVT